MGTKATAKFRIIAKIMHFPSRHLTTYFSCIALGLLLIASTGCVNIGYTERIDNLGPNEALIFGKLRIFYDGNEIKDFNLASNQAGKTGWGSATQCLGAKGIICAKVPAGDNYFFHIVHRTQPVFGSEYQYSFKPTDAILHLPQAGGFYYIGDILIDWTPPKRKAGDSVADFVTGTVYGGGLLGGLISMGTMSVTGGEAIIMVHDNLAESQKLFQERFNTDKKLVPAFLQIKSAY